MTTKQAKMIKIILLGEKTTGKHTLVKSFFNAFSTDSVSIEKSILINVKCKTYQVFFEFGNVPDRSCEAIKNVDMVLLCFRTDEHSSFEALFPWRDYLEKKGIESYCLIGNNFKEPYYSIEDIKTECVDFNEDSKKIQFKTLDFIDFSNTEDVKKLFETKISSFKFSNKKQETESSGNSCIIF